MKAEVRISVFLVQLNIKKIIRNKIHFCFSEFFNDLIEKNLFEENPQSQMKSKMKFTINDVFPCFTGIWLFALWTVFMVLNV